MLCSRTSIPSTPSYSKTTKASLALSCIVRSTRDPTSRSPLASCAALWVDPFQSSMRLRCECSSTCPPSPPRRLAIRGRRDCELAGQADSDWAIKHSTTGYVFNYSVAAISWASKKQTPIALSSCEAEVVALNEAAKEGVYLRRFLADLGFPCEPPTAVATDNTGAKSLAYNLHIIPSIMSG